MNDVEVIEKLATASASLQRFNTEHATMPAASLIESLAVIAECLQAMQQLVRVAESIQNSEIAECLEDYRTQLRDLPASLSRAKLRLVSHQQQLYGQITRLQRRSSWATSCKSSISAQIGKSLSIKG